ncbi:MAG TPA: GyrI-like domain-containing protein [Steroidobacteraceae bacterium]|nr:GyrI-like domain-containing protein [Steroidobacteraceae bacterium]
MKINLTQQPEIIQVQARPYLYLEKIGPFMVQAPKAWEEFSAIVEPLKNTLPIAVMAGLSKIDVSKQGDEQFIYQAGLFLKEVIAEVPKGLKVRISPAGKYARFVLTGGYHQLPGSYPVIFSILAKENIAEREEFCAEIYLNTPETASEENLKTEILVPVV